jgi:hypothetical protein
MLRVNQIFDQTKTFNTIAKAPANILARVTSHGSDLIAHVMTNSFRSDTTHFKIKMKNDYTHNRQRMDAKLNIDHLISEKQNKTLSTLGIKHPSSKVDHKPGDIVELQSCVLSDTKGELIVSKIVPLATAERAQSVLAMPEALSSILQIAPDNSEDPDKYMIAVAARSNATKIVDPITQMHVLGDLIDHDGGSDGFLIRGKKSRFDSKSVGFTCLRSPRSLQKHPSSREILLDFIKYKGSHFMSAISEDNPWEVLPVSLFNVAPVMREKVEMIARKLPEIVAIDGVHSKMSFVHMNFVARFYRDRDFARIAYIGLCRSKPLVIDTSIPDAATIRSIGISYVRTEQNSFACNTN